VGDVAPFYLGQIAILEPVQWNLPSVQVGLLDVSSDPRAGGLPTSPPAPPPR
jgi:hypothetical protein